MNQHPAALAGAHLKEVSIRPMRRSDLSIVIDLDARVFGKPRAAYFERRLAALEHADTNNHLIFLVADYHDQIIGFVMGTLASGEFGLAQVAAILDTIAVHPHYQRQHIGRQLVESFLSRSASLGTKSVYTLVPWENWELLKALHALGFSLASTIPLERHII